MYSNVLLNPDWDIIENLWHGFNKYIHYTNPCHLQEDGLQRRISQNLTRILNISEQ